MIQTKNTDKEIARFCNELGIKIGWVTIILKV
jgi:hypothetical protein